MSPRETRVLVRRIYPEPVEALVLLRGAHLKIAFGDLKVGGALAPEASPRRTSASHLRRRIGRVTVHRDAKPFG